MTIRLLSLWKLLMPDQVRHAAPCLTDASDRSLVRRLRAGSEDAATQLYLRYAKRLRGLSRAKVGADLAVRVDAEDIVQSVFRTFFRRAKRGEYDVPDGEELWKLFLVIGLHKIQTVGTFHRAAKRDVRAARGGDELDRAAEFAADESDEVSLSLLKMTIDELLGGLSSSHRDIVKLRIEGHEVATIAERLGRSKRSVERVLQGFREQLARVIGEGE